MEEFDAPQEHGVKQMRETIDRKDEAIKKLEAELASFKEKEIDLICKLLRNDKSKLSTKLLDKILYKIYKR